MTSAWRLARRRLLAVQPTHSDHETLDSHCVPCHVPWTIWSPLTWFSHMQATAAEAGAQAAMIAAHLGKSWGLSAADTGESARRGPLAKMSHDEEGRGHNS